MAPPSALFSASGGRCGGGGGGDGWTLATMGGVTTASTVMETPVTLASIAVVLLRLLVALAIADCTEGTIKLAESNIIEPLNIGSDELVSINTLVDMVEKLAGIKLKRSYKLDAPKGVRGRNSDNTLIKKVMNWAPSIRLEDGMEKTYKWIYDEMTSGKASVVNALPRAVAAQ